MRKDIAPNPARSGRAAAPEKPALAAPRRRGAKPTVRADADGRAASLARTTLSRAIALYLERRHSGPQDKLIAQSLWTIVKNAPIGQLDRDWFLGAMRLSVASGRGGMAPMQLDLIKRAVRHLAASLRAPAPAFPFEPSDLIPLYAEAPPPKPAELLAAVEKARSAAAEDGGQFALLVTLAGATRATLSELLEARWEDFDLGATPAWAIPSRSRAGPADPIPLSSEATKALALLRAMASGGGARVFHWMPSAKAASNALARFAAKHGLGDLRFEHFRTAEAKAARAAARRKPPSVAGRLAPPRQPEQAPC